MTPRVPDQGGRDVARAAGRRDELRRRLRGTGGRGRKLHGLVVLLHPYRGRVALMALALVAGTAAALAPAPLAKAAIDDGITKGDVTALDWIVLAFLVSALVVWAATYAQTFPHPRGPALPCGVADGLPGQAPPSPGNGTLS